MNKLVINGIYHHFKGNEYQVLGLGRETETEIEYVIYKNIHEDKIWLRPKDMFLSEVDHHKYPEVKQKYRFELTTK